MADAFPPPPAVAVSAATQPTLLRRLVALDTALSLRVHTLCQPVPRSLLKAFEISGDGRFWFPIPLALLPLSTASSGLPGADSARRLLLGLLLGSLLDLIFVGLVKHLVRRPRPVYNKGMSLTFAVDHWSFPSGHSSRVFFIASFLRLSATSLRALHVDGPLAPAARWIEGYYRGQPAELLLWILSIWSLATSASRVLLVIYDLCTCVDDSWDGVKEWLLKVASWQVGRNHCSSGGVCSSNCGHKDISQSSLQVERPSDIKKGNMFSL